MEFRPVFSFRSRQFDFKNREQQTDESTRHEIHVWKSPRLPRLHLLEVELRWNFLMSESTESTKSVRIVAWDWGPEYYRDLRQQLIHRGIRCDLTLIKNFFITECTAEKVRKVKEVLRRGRDEFTVLIPFTTELYLKEADLSLLFSAYKSRHAPDREKIIPWVWCNPSPEGIPDLNHWRWSTKPALSVGFQGNSYEGRKCVRWSLRLPKKVKDQLLAGRHLPFVYRGGKKTASIVPYLPCFARVEALKTLERAGFRTDVVRSDTDRKFDSQEEAQQDYERHMFRNAYILCPRGIENYSFRFYEALARGRVPVLIDTETVLPPGTDWNELCVRIPFAELGQLEERIVQDYESRTTADFIDRQEKAFKSFDRLRRMAWLSDIVEDIVVALR